MRNDTDLKLGYGCLIILLIMGIIVCVGGLNKDEGKTDADRYVTSDMLETVQPKKDNVYEEYKENRLETGFQPYDNEIVARGSESRIIVKTSGTDRTDVVVILKKNDRIVRNQYVQAGDQAVFNIPDGTYQIFFYYGKGWYPEKEMPNGMKGGFVMYESFSKDDPQYLENNILTYELILQTNGNFSARPSNAEEVFNTRIA